VEVEPVPTYAFAQAQQLQRDVTCPVLGDLAVESEQPKHVPVPAFTAPKVADLERESVGRRRQGGRAPRLCRGRAEDRCAVLCTHSGDPLTVDVELAVVWQSLFRRCDWQRSGRTSAATSAGI
jgi:hypothetical protein